ncbi:hypothetical protein Hanom_Chr01g00015441 [Helianthus anomalus]
MGCRVSRRNGLEEYSGVSGFNMRISPSGPCFKACVQCNQPIHFLMKRPT